MARTRQQHAALLAIAESQGKIRKFMALPREVQCVTAPRVDKGWLDSRIFAALPEAAQAKVLSTRRAPDSSPMTVLARPKRRVDRRDLVFGKDRTSMFCEKNRLNFA
jgi:hypothetical protein